MGIEPGWWRNGPEYILEHVWSRVPPQQSNFEPPNLNFHFRDPIFENDIFYFSSKYPFLNHESLNPRCTKCSYGPHGPCWFSVKKRQDMEQRYQIHGFWGKVTF